MGKNSTNLNTRNSTYIINSELKSVLMHMSDSLLIYPYKEDSITNFTEVNQSACDTYGYTREEFLQIDPSSINNIEDSINKEAYSFKKK